MKTEIKKVDSIRREISIEVSGDIVKNKFEDVFKRVARDAKVQGFRPGKAPRDIVEKQYGSVVRENVLRELVPDVYNEAMQKENLDVVGLPEITEVQLDKNSLSFKAKVEVSPEIVIENYKNIKINFKKTNVADDEVKRGIDSLKEQYKIEEVDDRLAKSLGYPGTQELERAIERQIFMNKENQEHARIENEIIENITKDFVFELPQSLIKRQLDDMLKQAKVDLALKGVPRETIDSQEKVLIEKLEPEAKKHVLVYLVFAQIAKKENIPSDDNMSRHVMEFLLREADWQVV